MANKKVEFVDEETGVGTVLFLVFLVLKLTGNIDWSWWWVTAPLWIPITLILVILLIMLVTAVLVSVFNAIRRK